MGQISAKIVCDFKDWNFACDVTATPLGNLAGTATLSLDAMGIIKDPFGIFDKVYKAVESWVASIKI